MHIRLVMMNSAWLSKLKKEMKKKERSKGENTFLFFTYVGELQRKIKREISWPFEVFMLFAKNISLVYKRKFLFFFSILLLNNLKVKESLILKCSITLTY